MGKAVGANLVLSSFRSLLLHAYKGYQEEHNQHAQRCPPVSNSVHALQRGAPRLARHWRQQWGGDETTKTQRVDDDDWSTVTKTMFLF